MEWEAIFVNDANNNYALTMEIWFGDEQIAIVRRRDGELSMDLYGTGLQPIVIPLYLLIDELNSIREASSASKVKYQTEICFANRRVARVEGFPDDLVIYIYGSGRKSLIVGFDWFLDRLYAVREDLAKPGTT